MDPVSALLALSPVRRVVLAGVGAAVLMALGAAAWDRMPLIGPHARIERLKATAYDLSGQVTWWKGYAANREEARSNCEKARRDDLTHSSTNINETAVRASGAAKSAFDAGYAAGKITGRQACTPGNPANAPSPADTGFVPAAPGVPNDQDLARDFNRSIYKPGGAVRP